jgi:hypothetical protein
MCCFPLYSIYDIESDQVESAVTMFQITYWLYIISFFIQILCVSASIYMNVKDFILLPLIFNVFILVASSMGMMIIDPYRQKQKLK